MLLYLSISIGTSLFITFIFTLFDPFFFERDEDLWIFCQRFPLSIVYIFYNPYLSPISSKYPTSHIITLWALKRGTERWFKDKKKIIFQPLSPLCQLTIWGYFSKSMIRFFLLSMLNYGGPTVWRTPTLKYFQIFFFTNKINNKYILM